MWHIGYLPLYNRKEYRIFFIIHEGQNMAGHRGCIPFLPMPGIQQTRGRNSGRIGTKASPAKRLRPVPLAVSRQQLALSFERIAAVLKLAQ
jgi:hypothetical protein